MENTVGPGEQSPGDGSLGDGSPGQGWWQASDGNWYPPETHPDYVPPAPLPTPALPAPAYEPPAAGPQFESVKTSESQTPIAGAPNPAVGAHTNAASIASRPWWKQWWLAALVAALCVPIAVVLSASGSNDASSGQLGSSADQTAPGELPSGAPKPTARPATPGEAGDPNVTVTAIPNVTAAPDDRADPFGLDTPVPVTLDTFGDADGSVWNVTVGAPRDMTAEVLATNEFNEPPPDGVAFVGFDVKMTLASADNQPLSAGFNLAWVLIGGESNAIYDERAIDGFFGCGLIDNEFSIFAEVFLGGTISGTVCLAMPVDEVAHPGTQPALAIDDSLVAFARGGNTPAPAELDYSGPFERGPEFALDVVAPVEFDSFDDAEGSVWNVRVGRLFDVTAEVLESSEFGEPPPDGILYATFDVEIELASAAVEPLAPGLSFDWEIIGGATAGVYDESTIHNLFGCGTLNDEFSNFDEVYAGGILRGRVCMALPVQDLQHPDTRIAMNFFGSRAVFSDDGDAFEPAEIEFGPGPAALANMNVFFDVVEVRWEVLSNVNNSLTATEAVWEIGLRPWADMTEDVLAESEFNEPPPDGVAFVAFFVEATLREAGVEQLSTPFNLNWQIHGGASLRVHQQSSAATPFGCGEIPGEVDPFGEIIVGGTVKGNVCVPIPIEDIDHPDTRIVLRVDDERIAFGPP